MRHYWLVLWEAPNRTIHTTITHFRRRGIFEWVTLRGTKKLLALTRISKKEAISLGYEE